MIKMTAAAFIQPDLLSSPIKDILFSGWDYKNIPYGQLTNLGSNQLIEVGRELRKRYIGIILPDDQSDISSVLYCRSTNFCRTVQSLRSLLSGLINVNAGESNDTNSSSNIEVDDYSQGLKKEKECILLPTILYKAKDAETMFPGAD